MSNDVYSNATALPSAIDDQDDVRRGQVIYEDIRTTASPLALDGKYGVET